MDVVCYDIEFWCPIVCCLLVLFIWGFFVVVLSEMVFWFVVFFDYCLFF